jgi:hypothetical protein
MALSIRTVLHRTCGRRLAVIANREYDSTSGLHTALELYERSADLRQRQEVRQGVVTGDHSGGRPRGERQRTEVRGYNRKAEASPGRFPSGTTNCARRQISCDYVESTCGEPECLGTNACGHVQQSSATQPPPLCEHQGQCITLAFDTTVPVLEYEVIGLRQVVVEALD